MSDNNARAGPPSPLFVSDSESEPEVEVLSGQSLKETAYRVYHDLWHEFYTWEQESSVAALAYLSRGPPYSCPPPLPESYGVWRRTEFAAEDDVEWFTIEDINPDTTERTRVIVGTEPVRNPGWKGYPRYTMCSPASRNLLGADDDNTRAPFASYADDKTFDLRTFLKGFTDFAWQNDFCDPDLDVIQLDVARRLHFRHNISIEEIDSLGIFAVPLRQRDTSGPGPGLIFSASQRDELRWIGNQLTDLPNFDLNEDDVPIEDAIARNVSYFCPNLNCLVTHCGLHQHTPPIIQQKPTFTKDMIRAMPGQACPNDCYKSIPEENINMSNAHWDDQDRALFKRIILVEPDASPCDVAEICRKPCVEVYVERLNFFKDEDIQDANNDAENIRFKDIEIHNDVVEMDRLPSSVGPCSHEGPCNQYATDCVCYTHRQRCTRGCQCPVTCNIRYKGCKCRPTKKNGKVVEICGGESCLCVLHNRECDPELCHISRTRHKPNDQGARTKQCSNMDLQKGKHVPIHVKESEYGLGAFAMANVSDGDCVGEYVGEILDTSIRLSDRQKHAGLNYTFTYTVTYDANLVDHVGKDLDSWNYGNETRYLNHSNTDANCGAKTWYVNGVYRIKLSAVRNIRKGEELTLNYGENYWLGGEKIIKENPKDTFDPVNIVWPKHL